jgi:hypothetical protein
MAVSKITKKVARSIARELRKHPRRWTRGGELSGRDRHGRGCWATAPEAVAWCIEGHITKRTHAGGYSVVCKEFIKAMDLPGALFVWNDAKSRRTRDVIRACERVSRS